MKTCFKDYNANNFVISIEDFNKILERFEIGNPIRYALLLGFYAGLRIGEVCALTWEDIDLNQGTLNVTKSIYKEMGVPGEKWYSGNTKTIDSVRKIKIGDTLVQELQEYKKMQAKNQLRYGNKANMIIRKENGEFLSPDDLKRATKEICRDLGIKFNFHMLRNTHKTMILES